MTERIEALLAEQVELLRRQALLAEQVELLRRQLANQERAIAEQTRSVAIQEQAVGRQQRALRIVWILIAFLLVMISVPWLINAWLRLRAG
jgi:hypothetical protein